MARKQMSIPGTERKQIKEVNDAAEHYVEQRDKRMGLTEKEHDAKEALIAVMKKHKIETYRDDDVTPPLVVTLVPGKDQIKVTEAEYYADDGYSTAPLPKAKKPADIGPAA